MMISRLPHPFSARCIAAAAILFAGLILPATAAAQNRGGRERPVADRESTSRVKGATGAEKEATGDPSALGDTTTTTGGGVIKVEPAKLDWNDCLARKARKAKHKLSFSKGTELLELVELISKMTCKRFIVSETLRAQKVTILSPEKISVEEAYKAFLSALDVMGLTVVPAGRYLKIVQGNWAIQGPIKTYADRDKGRTPISDNVVTQILQIKNVDVNELLLVLNKLKSRNGDVTAYKASNSLIITDNGYNIRRMLYLVKELDIEAEGEKIWVVRLKYADPDEVNKILSQLFSTTGNQQRIQVRGRPGQQQDDASQVWASKIVSDSASNSLIIVATTGSFNRIASLIKKLDVEEDAAMQKVHVFYLENADAEDLANTLGSLTGTTGNRNVRGRRPARRPGAGGQQAASLFEGDVKISADKPTNSLVIVATTKDYLNVRGVIKMLDIPRRQVFVEASILEISMDNTREVGFAYHGGGVAGEGDSESLVFGGVESSDLNSLLVNPLGMMGLAVGVRGSEIDGSGQLLGVGTDIPGFGVMFQALQNNSDVNILSSPHILTTDNEEAEITVGQNLPFQGAMMGGGLSGLAGAAGAAGGAASSLASFLPGVSVQRQDVALKMKITPHVNDSDMVRLELEQEVSDIISQNFNGMGPATSKRSAKTVVVVRDQQTVVIGGLMGNRIRNSVSKVPILGDIPILGYLFKYKKKTTEKTNLLIVLTPYIIRDQTDLRRILKKKMEERREFIERYTSFKYKEISADVDFRHKRGLLAEINRVAVQAEDEAKLMEEARKASMPEDVEPVEMPTGMTVQPTKGGVLKPGNQRIPASEIRQPPRPQIRARPGRIQ